MSATPTYFHLKLSKDELTVELTINASSKERAIALYEGLEKIITKMQQADLELAQRDKPEK